METINCKKFNIQYYEARKKQSRILQKIMIKAHESKLLLNSIHDSLFLVLEKGKEVQQKVLFENIVAESLKEVETETNLAIVAKPKES